MRRWIGGWTLLVVVGWLLAAAAWSSDEANCDPSTSLICISPKGIWLITALYAAIAWMTGLGVIAIGWLITRGWRNNDAEMDESPD